MKEAIKAMMMPEELGDAMRQWRQWTTAKRVVNVCTGLSLAALLVADPDCSAWAWVAAAFATCAITGILMNLKK